MLIRRFCLLGALATLSLTATGCESDCTDEARAGLRVIVTDADTGERVCDAEVTAYDGSFSELLFAYGDPNCSYQGAFERTGFYRIEVKHADYETTESDIVEVLDDGCHVILQDVIMELQPAP